MALLTVGSENGHPVEVHFEDHGDGPPVMLLHGFPLDGGCWERQCAALLQAGYRVIVPTRRGFGRSSRPRHGYDFDTFAADLHHLIGELDLTDLVLIGWSMGTADIVRYLGRYGSARISRAVCLGMLPPFLVKTDDNPDGLDAAIFDDIKASIRADRYAYFEALLRDFYRTDIVDPSRWSDQVLRANFNVAADSSAEATIACVTSWLEDFRGDVPAFEVPLLILHGTDDVNCPIDVTARRWPALKPDTELIEFPGAGHMIAWTHSDEVNDHILRFLAGQSVAVPGSASHLD